ncbi:hypothetical protein Syun_011495 [Stephania yunnanensis]|uniref:Exostosin GT47 domain-containing protein n=1 Tax=Stephania yunnanensis TaxID=152371 RepID=A0AAP0JZV4_9MAGN
MEFSPQFQKMCQVETRRLLMGIGMIASFVLIFQFLSLPYGNLLTPLLPGAKLPMPGKANSTSEDSISKSAIIGPSSRMDDKSFTDEMEKTAKRDSMDISNDFSLERRSQVGAFEHANVTKATDKYSPEKVIDPGMSFDIENVEDSHNDSVAQKMRELENSNGRSSNIARKEDVNLRLDGTEGGHIASVSSPHLSVPIVSTDAPATRKELDENSSSSANANISSVTKQLEGKTSKDERPESLRRFPAHLNVSSPITNDRKKGLQKSNQNSVMSISDMNLLLLQNRASSQSAKPRWSTARDEEILAVRRQIHNAAITDKGDPELFPPLFRNISKFKRSYELMERTLKVYVYKEGANPIFHRPITKGIYASEGWFMKQMEGNKKFVVKNPKRAHLFYLPFSSRMLETTLYVPNSHSHKNLVQYLKDYIDLISTKYPFWNRTGGADHFLVACHDWAPTETRQSYMGDTIRALCNADVREGFVIGKDVSLPETLVLSPKEPSKDPGGKHPSQRQILAFFAGNMHGYLRPILLQQWENKDSDMKIFGRMGRGTRSKMNYIQHMKSSKYCICAKGFEVNSPRVVESILYECVPVIISDNYVPPFFEVLNWEEFAVFVAEKDIPNLKNILLSIPRERYLMMHMRIKKLQQHFMWHTRPMKYDIFHMILHSIWYNRVFQISPK